MSNQYSSQKHQQPILEVCQYNCLLFIFMTATTMMTTMMMMTMTTRMMMTTTTKTTMTSTTITSTTMTSTAMTSTTMTTTTKKTTTRQTTINFRKQFPRQKFSVNCFVSKCLKWLQYYFSIELVQGGRVMLR